MSNSKKHIGRKVPFALAIMATILACNAHAGADEVSLLNSLLERGLIAPEDYAAEMRLQGRMESVALASARAEAPRRDMPSASVDTRLDYLPLVAMSEGAEAPQTATHHAGADDHAEHGHEHHNHFEGAYMVITEEWKGPSVRVDGEKIKKSEAAPSFGVGYTFALTNQVTLGLKASIDFKNGEFGSGDVASLGGERKVLEKSHYSIAVEPGYVIDDQTLVFGILAYHRAKTAFEDGTETKGISGVGYGIGFKRSLASHVFLMGEIQQVKYGSATIDNSTVKPTSNTAALGLGYHF